MNNNRDSTLCLGTEWYTFPSHFFLPEKIQIKFINDEFHGLLPQYFNHVNGTSTTPSLKFNTLNKEELDRYVQISSCDYVVTYFNNESFDKFINKRYFKSTKVQKELIDNFELVLYKEVIDSPASKTLSRAFHIPFYSSKHNKYSKYILFKNKNK